LLYDEVQFRLGMIVVDEQHKFGVRQRMTLRAKGRAPHVLVMTATPIPRSMTLTLYGDLDLSVIDEMPPDRRPVRTTVMGEARREQAYAIVRREVKQRHQAYIVYPLIEIESWSRCPMAMAQHLQHDICPEFHWSPAGRLPSDEKDAIMQACAGRLTFWCHGRHRNGVDVANATMMLVENAEHFGLAQLHQLRGRVGREVAGVLRVAHRTGVEQRRPSALARHARKYGRFFVAEQDLQIVDRVS
jgi:ATP-dependent DNA helicase RecG